MQSMIDVYHHEHIFNAQRRQHCHQECFQNEEIFENFDDKKRMKKNEKE